MSRLVQDKTRLRNNIETLERLVLMLKLAEQDKVSLVEIANEYNMIPQTLTKELNSCFTSYCRSKCKELTDDEIYQLIKNLESPSDRLLKQILGINKSVLVVFPEYDPNQFWDFVKDNLKDSYFDVVTKHVGYNSDSQVMSYEDIGKTLSLSRARVQQIDVAAIKKLQKTNLVQLFTREEYKVYDKRGI